MKKSEQNLKNIFKQFNINSTFLLKFNKIQQKLLKVIRSKNLKSQMLFEIKTDCKNLQKVILQSVNRQVVGSSPTWGVFYCNKMQSFCTGWTLTSSRPLHPRVKRQRSTSNALPPQQRFGVVSHFVHASARARLRSFLLQNFGFRCKKSLIKIFCLKEVRTI